MTEFERIRQELERWPHRAGVTPSNLLELSEPLRSLVKRTMREGTLPASELRERLGLTIAEAETVADLMVRSGLLTSSGEGEEAVYRLRRARTHRPRAPGAIWDRLIDDGEEGA